jgi:dienelactone hydrolase
VTPDARPVVAGRAIAAALAVAVLAVLLLVAACTGRPAQPQQATTPAEPVVSSHPVTPSPSPTRTADIGSAGTYQVGQRRMTFVEPAHKGPTGQYLGQRMLLTVVWYPLAPGSRGSSGSQPARGPFPLLMFAPGFMQCGSTYSDLLRAWASAGYVVAVVNFPRTDCVVGADAYEPDLVNQPGDMSYVLGRLLALSAQPRNLLSGLLNRHEIAAAGQSDGGDTVAALAADTCCADYRLRGVAVLSGAEWPPMPGPYFARGGLGIPPMLFVQGTADTINPPWTSVQLYRSDEARARYYLDLFGADHMIPYTGTNPVEHLVARVTLAFFDRYVLGHAGALATMTRDGNVSGAAALFSGGRLPP